MALPPPVAWADLGPGRPAAPARGTGAGATTPEQLTQAWKHLRSITADSRSPADLYDLLSHSVRESSYSFQPQGVSGRMWSPAPGGWRQRCRRRRVGRALCPMHGAGCRLPW